MGKVNTHGGNIGREMIEHFVDTHKPEGTDLFMVEGSDHIDGQMAMLGIIISFVAMMRDDGLDPEAIGIMLNEMVTFANKQYTESREEGAGPRCSDSTLH